MFSTETHETLMKRGWNVRITPAFDDQVNVALMVGDDRWIDQQTVHYHNIQHAIENMIEAAA